MPSPILFGRRMKRFANVWILDIGPLTFNALEFENRPRRPYRALMLCGGVLHEHRECLTLSQALRSLVAMRNRLVRQLQDKA
jgi:hypothetical protein